MSTFTHDLCLQPCFSQYFAGVFALFYCGALTVLSPLAMPLLIKLSLGLCLIGHALVMVHRHLTPINHPLYGSILHKHTLKLLSQRHALISPDSYSFPLVVVLRATTIKPYHTYTLVIFSDALDQNTFRRLRVRLRYPYYQ